MTRKPITRDKNLRCPVCQGKAFSQGSEVFDDRYGEPNLYRLANCKRCGHLATTPQLRESDLPTLYGTYYPRKLVNSDDVASEGARVKRPLAKFLRWLNGTDNQGQYRVRAGQLMLDVGCGSGVSLIEAKALGAVAFGIEADPNVKQIAEALSLNIHFGSLEDQPFAENRFDLIVMNQVIEHFPNPDLALKTLRGRLTSNGRMVLVFPNTASLWRRLSGKRWINWHIPYHLHHFDLKHFERMAQQCGLEVLRSRTITPNVWSLLQLQANRYQAKRGQPSPIWLVAGHSESGSATKSRSKVLLPILRMIIFSIFAVFNRIVDSLGIGDSLMVELRRAQKQ